MLTEHFLNWHTNDFQLHVKSFPDGKTFFATDWYKPNQKFVVLLDGVMPEMDGLEVLEKIKSNYPEKDILVSMLTARKEDDDIVKALEMGADDYIQKPFNPKEVMVRIQRLVQRMF